jgi:hypothetical protein
MSLPGAITGPSMASVIALSPLENMLQVFNTNPYFIGGMMLILNLGGRFISLEVTKQQELFLQHPWVRRILIFTVLFVATRNLWVAFWATVVVILFLGYLFNENSPLCLFPSASSPDANHKKEEMTPEEKEILQRLMSKAQRYQGQDGKNDKNDAHDKEEDVLFTDIYAANLSLLKG